jgi:hypothetical protein
MIHKETLADILVFKTNVCQESDLQKVAAVISEDGRIRRWNVDQDDIDNVLRIESSHLHPEDVIELIRKAGFYCEELPD